MNCRLNRPNVLWVSISLSSNQVPSDFRGKGGVRSKGLSSNIQAPHLALDAGARRGTREKDGGGGARYEQN